MNFDKLTAYLDSLSETYGVPGGDCKITKDHNTVFRHKIGCSDYQRQIPVTEKNLYRFYSATKVITMTAVLQLMEKKKLDLYDEVRKYLPEFTNLRIADHFPVGRFPVKWPDETAQCHFAHTPIRIIDLMSMTAGLSYDTSSQAIINLKVKSHNTASTQEVVAAIAKAPLIYEPGTRWSYSLAHDVLAALIEVISQKKFSQYLKENIFNPLEITDLYFKLDETLKQRLCALYAADFNSGKIGQADPVKADSFTITENYESGGAGLIGTVNAYSDFIDALCNGGIGKNGNQILSEDSIRLFSTNYTTGQLLEDFQKAGKKGYGYGLGVRVLIDQNASKSPLGEFGWDGAAGAYALVDPVNHISIFYVQHIMGFPAVYSEIHPTIRDLAYEAII